MYERFTDRARKVLQLANQEAVRARHEYIGTEHILLGLAAEGSGVAANVFQGLGIDADKIRQEVRRIILDGQASITLGKRPQTPKAKRVFEYAIEEARALNHNYVGTEHLLLGLLREHDGVAGQVLLNLGLNLAKLREEVQNILGWNPPVAKPASPLGSKSPDEEEKFDLEESTSPHRDGSPRQEVEYLPAPAREIVAEFDCQIDVIKEDKEQAVGAQEFDKAAGLFELERKLRRLREEFIRQWPRS